MFRTFTQDLSWTTHRAHRPTPENHPKGERGDKSAVRVLEPPCAQDCYVPSTDDEPLGSEVQAGDVPRWRRLAGTLALPRQSTGRQLVPGCRSLLYTHACRYSATSSPLRFIPGLKTLLPLAVTSRSMSYCLVPCRVYGIPE